MNSLKDQKALRLLIISAAFVLSSGCLKAFADEPELDGELNISYTTINADDFKTDWEMNDEELVRYQRYMQTTGKFFYTHLDPLMVLGFIEKNPAKRAAFAERHLAKSRERFTNEKIFVVEVGAAQRRVYPGELPYDFSDVAGYEKHQTKRQALTIAVNAAGKSVQPRRTPISTTAKKFNWSDETAVYSVDVLIGKDCNSCVNSIRKILQDTPETVIVNVYSDTSNTDHLTQVFSALKPDIKPARIIAAKRFDSIIFAGIAEPTRPVVRRNGLVVARL